MHTTFVLTRVRDSLTCAVYSCAVQSAFSSDLCTCNRLMILTRAPQERLKTKSAQDTLQTDSHVPLAHIKSKTAKKIKKRRLVNGKNQKTNFQKKNFKKKKTAKNKTSKEQKIKNWIFSFRKMEKSNKKEKTWKTNPLFSHNFF